MTSGRSILSVTVAYALTALMLAVFAGPIL